MTEEQSKKLEYPFTFDEIEWRVLRVSKKKPAAQVAAYVDSRAIQNRLDEVIGRENWQNDFETVVGSNNNGTANICKLSIYYKDRGEWITKSDGAGCTDVEPIKGGLSNAFKRSASMWGIGRYLYELKNVWVEIDEYKCIAQHEYPKLERLYNQFVGKYLKGSGTADTSAQTAPKQEANLIHQDTIQQPAPTTAANIPNGRFAGIQSSPTELKFQKNGCRILDLKVTKGARSSQTLVTLENCNGKTLQGYIQGEPELKTGQIILNPKITTKSSPIVGDYNIIESYSLAA